jgi:hypothetical protein
VAVLRFRRQLLRPPEQLWVIAQAVQDNGGPGSYVTALRALAGHLEELGWWLAEAAESRPAGRP